MSNLFLCHIILKKFDAFSLQKEQASWLKLQLQSYQENASTVLLFWLYPLFVRLSYDYGKSGNFYAVET